MIEINYDRENLILKAKGHANSAEYGKDLVCAAVSALVQTLAGNVICLKNAEVAKDEQIILEEGNALVSCRAVNEKETLLCVYDTITTGLILLQQTYPQYIKYTENNITGLEKP